MKIEDIGNESEVDFDMAITEFFESCLRTGHYDMTENAEYFCRENELDASEFDEVYNALKELVEGLPEF